MSIQQTVDLIIDEAIARAREQADEAQTKVDKAVEAASLLIQPPTPASIPDPDLNQVQIGPPPSNYLEIFQAAQYYLEDKILSSANSEYNNFVNQYFPLLLNSAQVDWLTDKILNGDTGLPAHIEDALWDRGLDRINEQLARDERDVTERFASFGWADPPGALAHRLRRIRQEARMKACEFNRDVYIDQAGRAQQNVQFAVAEATKLQKTIWDAADAFSSSVTKAIGPAVQSGAAQTEAAIKFYDQTLEYYRTFLFAQAQAQDTIEKNTEIQFRINDQAIKILGDRARTMTEAALGAAKVFGDMSSASLSGQNTMANAVVSGTAS